MDKKISSEEMEAYIIRHDPPAYGGPQCRLAMKIDLPILLEGNLCPLDKILLFTLYSLEEAGECSISEEQMSWMMRASKVEVRKSLESLQAQGRVSLHWIAEGKAEIEVHDSSPDYEVLDRKMSASYLNVSDEQLEELIEDKSICYDGKHKCCDVRSMYIWKRYHVLLKKGGRT